MTPDRIQQATEAGERNATIVALVENWCAHARVKKFGGTGYIEAMTGLPIGHHSLACDHANARGVASWDLADAAIDFYDRNCVDCRFREPVGLPNISMLVQDRDANRLEQQKIEAVKEKERARQFDKRQRVRQKLRAKLRPPAVDLVDQIEEIDSNRTLDLAQKLVKTAEIAPDAFTRPVIEYVFSLVEARERWFTPVGFRVLRILPVDPVRLTRLALMCLQHHDAVEDSASVIVGSVDQVDPRLIPAALPSLIQLANPPYSSLIFRDRDTVTTPLLSIYSGYPDVVASALEDLLGRQDPEMVSLAARAIVVLAHLTPELPVQLARPLTAKLARAKWAPDPNDIDGDDRHREIVHEIRQALTEACRQSPDIVDDLIEKFLLGADAAGEARLFSVCRDVLRADSFEKEAQFTHAHQVAFRRLLWQAPRTNNESVLKEIRSVVSSGPYGLIALAHAELDGLLGAALLMDERLSAFDAAPRAPNASGLLQMERLNTRLLLSGLRDDFLKWASEGAVINEAGVQSYVDTLAGLPEDRESLQAAMVGEMQPLMTTAKGLNDVLPFIYSAMVGVSVPLRAASAGVVGKLRSRERDNAPDLLFEAFTALLTDPYKMVHKAAVSALTRFQLPDPFASRARAALGGLVRAYAEDQDDSHFLVECIALYVRRHATCEELEGSTGAYLVQLLKRAPAYETAKEIRYLARALGRSEGFVDLLVQLLQDVEINHYTDQDVITSFFEVPVEALEAASDHIAVVMQDEDEARFLWTYDFIEVLTQKGAWAQAAALTEATRTSIPETAWDRPRRLSMEVAEIATQLEATVASGDLDRVSDLTERWRAVFAELERDRIENAERRNPHLDLRSSDLGD